MFEKIVVRTSTDGTSLTLGELAEALLFYQNVHIILDHGSLNGFLLKLGVSKFLELFSRPNVSGVYVEELLGTQTQIFGVTPRYMFGAFTLGDTEGVPESHLKRLELVLRRQGHSNRSAKKYAEKFLEKIPVRHLTSNYYVKGGILQAANADLDDTLLINEAIRIALLKDAPDALLDPFKIEVVRQGIYFFVFTDSKFDSILKRRAPETANTMARLIGNVLNARADTILAAHYGGEFYTSEVTSSIVRLRHRELLKRIGIDQKEIEQFNEIVLSDCPSLREVINSGERTFDEFLELLDKADRFKRWVGGVNADRKLVDNYVRDASAQGWINSLPGKAIRYVIGTAVGIVEPITGAAASAADTFLAEKILGGWRPNHFVDRA